MRICPSIRRSACALIALLVAQGSLQAAPLAVFGTQHPVPGEAKPVGGLIVGSLSSPIVSPTFTGTLLTTVIAGDTSNSLAGLTFTYQLVNNGASVHPMERLTINGFAGWTTDTSYSTLSAGLPPGLANRPVADVVGFSFLDPPLGPGTLVPGTASAVMVVQTNAPAFAPNIASVIDGFVATTPTLAPIPEPASGLMLTLGAVLLVMRRRGV